MNTAIKISSAAAAYVVAAAVFCSCAVKMPFGVSGAQSSHVQSAPGASQISEPGVSYTQSTEASAQSIIETNSESSSIDVIVPVSQDKNLHGLSESECNDFFNDTIFIGDSIMEGFKSRVDAMKSQNSGCFGSPSIFATRNFGYFNAFKEIKDGVTTYHPVYKGKQTYVWDLISELKPKRVFILLGLNDIAGADGAKNAIVKLKQLASRIIEVTPEVELTFISTTYYTRSGEKPGEFRTNSIYRGWNESVLQYCNAEGFDYIDLANTLVDGDGYFIDEYAWSDGLHIKPAGYDIWCDYLRGYAADKILGSYTNIKTMLR